MANLMFKRGIQSKLNDLNRNGGIVDGIFYLTTDTNRLYVGRSKGTGVELVNLNQYIKVVQNVSALPSTDVADGDFAYLVEENILAVYKTDHTPPWVQINQNTDTLIQTLKIEKDSSSEVGVNKINITLTDSANLQITDFFNLLGSNGIDVGSEMVDEHLKITVEGDIYTLDSEFATSGADGDPAVEASAFTINLNSGKSVDGAGGSTTLKPGEHIKFKKDADGALIIGGTGLVSGDGTVVNESPSGLQNKNTNDLVVSGGAATVYITDTNGVTATASVDAENGFYYTINNQPVYNQSELDVYTKGQVDTKLKDLNGLTYKGTVATWLDIGAKQTAGVSVGDMYLLSETPEGVQGKDDVVFSDDFTVASLKKGDLIIATSSSTDTPENASGIIEVANIRWTVVPSGDETIVDTTYTGTVDTVGHKVKLHPSTDSSEVVLGLDLEAGDCIELTSISDDSGKTLKTTIAHGSPLAGSAITLTNVPSETENDSSSVETIQAIKTDEFGHLVTVETKTVNLLGYELSGSEVAKSDKTVTVSNKLMTSANGEAGTSTFKLSESGSDNISLSVNSNEITVAMTWGEF